MRHRILAAIAIVCTVALSATVAGAHGDHNPDGNNNSDRRCDTYYRTTHESGSTANTKHSEDHEEPEFDDAPVLPGTPPPNEVLGLAGMYLHRHTGHYVVRGDAFYVEVVGGGGYSRNGAQGGYVQGEVDAAEGAPDADFHTNTFADPDGTHYEAACVSVADNKVGDEGEQP